jgi:hypothetical protein
MMKINKVNVLIAVLIFALAVFGWFAYQKATDETYEGMSIIPEKHEDIPLYKGLEPRRTDYVIEGNQWRDIYTFYLENLPRYGWKVEYKQSAADWSGFMSRWTKPGFDGALSVSAHYNKFEEQTEVIFDKRGLYKSTAWIENAPESVRVCKQSKNDCFIIKENKKIKSIVRFVNRAPDAKKRFPEKHSMFIEFDHFVVKVHHKKEKEIYLKSEKGIKVMKPDPGFLRLIHKE